MRPYWAVIVDSFRESLNSKVLWCLLGIITLLLLALIPIGISFTAATHLHHSEIENTVAFAKQLQSGGSQAADNPRRVVWEGLNEDLRTDLKTLTAAESPGGRDRFRAKQGLAEGLNDLMDSKDLFSDEQMLTLAIGEEAKTLLATPAKDRGSKDRRRLHRLALASLYPRYFRQGESESMLITYFGMELSDPLPFDRGDRDTGVKYSLIVFMSVFAAPFGMLTAILVTASIIPNMFDAGSVNLLFSKPINRSLLYLSKFFGGCWFVFINATYLIVGLWLIIGWRLDIWHEKLLWVIPVLTFLFAVYYSVSALAGVIWRNTIMCIVAAVLVWGICFVVGFTHELIESLVIQPSRIVRVVDADGTILTVSESGSVARWNPETNRWISAFAKRSKGGPPAFAQKNQLLGPIYDEQGKRILAVDRNYSNSQLIAGSADENWRRERVDAAPTRSLALLIEPSLQPTADGDNENKNSPSSGGFLVVDRDGISRMAQQKGPGTKELNFFGAKYTLGPKRGSFKSVGPKPYDFINDADDAVINPKDGSLYIYAPGRLHRLEPRGKERKFEVTQEREIFNDKTKAILAVGGNYLLVAPEQGDMELLNAETLETVSKYPKSEAEVPRQATTSPDGRYLCVVFHNKSVWCFDGETKQVISNRIPRQSSITTLAFARDGQMLIASDPPQVESFDLANNQTTATYLGEYPLLDWAHYRILRPFYRVFPKPGKLKETAEYLMLDKTTVVQGPDKSLSGPRAQFRPWKPVWESAIFTGVMLLLACIYIQRQEL